MNKKIKLILETVVICIILFSVFYAGFMAYSKRLTYDKMKTDNSSYISIETIDDQEVHIDGFPVIYIEGNNEISKEHWEGFLADLQNECNIPWLTKNVSSIHFCSDDVFDDALSEESSENYTTMGLTKYKDNSVYIRENGSAGYEYIILHEFGHTYDHAYGITNGNYDISVLTSNQKKVCKHANKMSNMDYEYCSSNIRETFASVIQFYITARNTDLVPEEVFNWIDTLPR